VISAQPLLGRIELGRSFTGESFLAELEKSRNRRTAVLGTASRAPATTSNGRSPPSGNAARRRAGGSERQLLRSRRQLSDRLAGVAEIGRETGIEVAPVTLFESADRRRLARQLAAEAGLEQPRSPPPSRFNVPRPSRRGLARHRDHRHGPAASPARRCRAALEELRDGIESVRFFTDEELAAGGVESRSLRSALRAGRRDPRRRRSFDAGLFGYSPREAEVTDPQQRCSSNALGGAGARRLRSVDLSRRIGVFAGSNLSTYLLRLYADPAARASVNMLQAILGNDKDSLTTTVSYKLNLRGRASRADLLLDSLWPCTWLPQLRGRRVRHGARGGVRIVVPDHQGYLYEQGGLAPSDALALVRRQANGSVLGHGAGIVCLKRLTTRSATAIWCSR